MRLKYQYQYQYQLSKVPVQVPVLGKQVQVQVPVPTELVSPNLIFSFHSEYGSAGYTNRKICYKTYLQQSENSIAVAHKSNHHKNIAPL